MNSRIFRSIACAAALVAACISPHMARAQNVVLQSSTAHPIIFGPIVQSSDHTTALTGLVSGTSLTVTISKDGGSFAAPSGSVTEVGNGYYEIAGNAVDDGTLGKLIVHWVVSGGTAGDASETIYSVVAYNPYDSAALGLTTVTGINTKIGTPSTSVSADIAAVNGAVASNGTAIAVAQTDIIANGTAIAALPTASAIAAAFGAQTYITIDTAHSSDGTSFTITKKQWDAMMSAIQVGDSLTPTAPVASGTATIKYYIPMNGATTSTLCATGTVSYDANKVQTGRTYKVLHPLPSIP